MCAVAAQAQTEKLTVTGTVVDENGEPMIGATVYIKDQPGKGVVSDLDGRFSIDVKRGDKIVTTYVGYKRNEYLVLKTENVKIKLLPDAAALEEVVVEAYGNKTRKISATGAVTSVDV